MLKLFGDKVAVQPKRFNPRTPSGLYIPDEAQPRINQGIVKYLGPNVKDVKLGQWVIFSAYSGTHLRVEDEEVIIMEERFVSAILNEPDIRVSGLFARDYVTGEYFEVTLEIAAEFMENAVREIPSTDFDRLPETKERESNVQP